MTLFASETQQSIADWSHESFGTDATDLSILTRANIEMAELLHALATNQDHDKIAAECADVVIVLCRFATRRGLDLEGITPWKPQDSGLPVNVLARAASNDLNLIMQCIDINPLYVWDSILCHLVNIATRNYRWLSAAIDKKMAINRARKWVVTAGHGQHVKE